MAALATQEAETDMNSQNPQDLLEFPCHYQFKAVGVAGADFSEAVIRAVDSMPTFLSILSKAVPAEKEPINQCRFL